MGGKEVWREVEGERGWREGESKKGRGARGGRKRRA